MDLDNSVVIVGGGGCGEGRIRGKNDNGKKYNTNKF